MKRSIVLAVLLVLSVLPARAHTAGSQCFAEPTVGALRVADQLMRNEYAFIPYRTVTLPADPTWRENPFHSGNWQFQFQALRYVDTLRSAWISSGDRRYLDRYTFLLKDWMQDNPRAHPRSPWSWDKHATGWRATVYACAWETLPHTTWLRAALVAHGDALADPGFYVKVGNHALNQDQGLLALGCVMGRSSWISTASSRLNDLLSRSVDAQGVDDEQSVGYEYYNYNNYRLVQQRLTACGRAQPPNFSRVDKMPTFLAFATRPDGVLETLGDTDVYVAPPIPGTPQEFAASAGAQGAQPSTTHVSYAAGFAFGRSGWGRARAFSDEAFYSLRWGPSPYLHGHEDGESLTYYAYGAPLVLDPGKYTYVKGGWRRYFTGRTAHNVVVARGLATEPAATSRIALRTESAYDFYALRQRPYAGITMERRMLFARALGFVVVEDRVTSSKARTFDQLWHLPQDARAIVTGSSIKTRRAHGNLTIKELYGGKRWRVVTGATDPIQGWVSPAYGHKFPAPAASTMVHGTRARWITVLAPGAGSAPSIGVRSLSVTDGGFAVTLTIGGGTFRVSFGGTTGSIRRIS